MPVAAYVDCINRRGFPSQMSVTFPQAHSFFTRAGYSEFKPYTDTYDGGMGVMSQEYVTETPGQKVYTDYSYTPAPEPELKPVYVPVEPEVCDGHALQTSRWDRA